MLQGPPGTGKSQTITNIISEALADGKKVLFVSEKMAALEVVHKRLTESKLSDFCLMLHSYKANKKEVLSELNRTLNLDKVRLQDDALYQLRTLEKKRSQLNQYVSELHTTCKPLNKSIYEINGSLARLKDSPYIIFDIQNVEKISTEQLHETLYLIETYSKIVGKMSFSIKENPWRGVLLDSIGFTRRQSIEKNIQELLPMLRDISKDINELIKEQQIGIGTTMQSVLQLKTIYSKIANCPGVPSEWVLSDDIKPLLKNAEEYNGLMRKYISDYKSITLEFNKDIIKLDGADLKNKIDTSWERINKHLIDIDINEYINNREDAIHLYMDIRQKLEFLIKDIAYLNQIGLEVSENFFGIEESAPLLKYLSTEIHPTKSWFDTQSMNQGKELCGNFQNRYNSIKLIRTNILDKYDEEIFNIDYTNMLKRFKTDYISFTKIFKKEYRMDKKIIQGLSREIQKKIEDSTILDLLTQLRELENNIQWIRDNQNEIKKFLGKEYIGRDTDWCQVRIAINNFELLEKELGDIPCKVQNNMVDNQIDTKLLIEMKGRFNEFLSTQKDETIFKIWDNNERALPDIIEILAMLILETEEIDNIIDRINSYSNIDNKYESVSGLIEKLISVQEIDLTIRRNEESLKRQFVTEYRGLETDWENVKSQLDWVTDFKNTVDEVVLTDKFYIESCEDIDFQLKCAELENMIEIMLIQVDEKWKWFCSLFDENQKFNIENIDNVVERVEKCVNNMSSLEEWMDFCEARMKCDDAGLNDFIDNSNKFGIQASEFKGVYLKRFYTLWLDAMTFKYPAVNSFRRRSRESQIEEFISLDKEQMLIARSRIKAKLIQELPDINRTISANDEVAILRRELNKKRRIMPLRKLFRTIPNLLMSLKPCLMMSPLSVSLFLQADSYDFDIVVFDEASQIHTEDAIGAIIDLQ